MSAAHGSGALARLDSMAAAGSLLDDVAHEAEEIAAGWWWNEGASTPERLVLLVQELQHLCAVAGSHARRWDHLNRAGPPREVEDAARWIQVQDQAQRVLHLYA